MFLDIDLLPLKGRSGLSYTFNVHPITVRLPPVGGVYIVAKMSPDPDRTDPAVVLIYLGHAKDLSRCLVGHTHNFPSGTDAPNAILSLQAENETAQMAIQLDLSHMLSPAQQDALPPHS